MLHDIEQHKTPFPYFTAKLNSGLCEQLGSLARLDLDWQRHDSFYHCWIAHAAEHIRLPQELPGAVAALLDLPLTDAMQLTIQRMGPGDHALPHTDRPLLGFEAARLVVQLTPDWSLADGGLFAVHPDSEGTRTTRTREPLFASVVGFGMRLASHHSVRPVHTHRLTAVVHFWHHANTPALHAQVRDLLEGASFAALPASLDATLTEAEAEHSEEETLRAGTVALLLTQWGADELSVERGYRAGLEPWTGCSGDTDIDLARWAAKLWLDCFDIDAWEEAAARVGHSRLGPAKAFRALAFPPSAV
ncbi:MAG: 2OG-Fe(II) oxygenase [Proteobacteria bacterium]|nr:2OG-Fe(II) oxygenase [Pseudomonadota bacterium]